MMGLKEKRKNISCKTGGGDGKDSGIRSLNKFGNEIENTTLKSVIIQPSMVNDKKKENLSSKDKKNDFKIIYIIYQKAHEFVKYNLIWDCRRNHNSIYVRHNYRIISQQRIKCVDCDKILSLSKEEIIYSIITLSQKDLRELDRNKSQQDITIYAIKIKEEYKKKLGIKKKKFYIGQTTSRITVIKSDKIFGKNRWIGHLDNIFPGNHHNSILSNVILKYCKNNTEALEIFEIMLLQIIKDQGDRERTQKIADNAEKFWIGFFHTQFIEFGWNIGEGGNFGVKKKDLISFKDLENAVVASLDLHKFDRPMEYLIERLGKSDYIINNNIIYHYKDIYGDYVENYETLRKIRIVYDRIIPLIEEGYNSVEIENHQCVKLQRRQILDVMRDVLKDPNYNFQEFQNELLIIKIRSLIKSGFLRYDEIANHFKALNASAIETFIRYHMRGIKKEVLECYVKSKACSLLKVCSSGRQLLKKLVWLKEESIRSYSNSQIDEKMYLIFGMNFEEAKLRENKLRRYSF